MTAQDCSSCYRNFYLTNFLPLNFLFLIQFFWQVPRQAHTYFVDHLLSCDHSSVRMDILAKFGKFVKFRKCNSTSTSPAGDRCQCAKHQPDDGEGGSRAEEGHCAQ